MIMASLNPTEYNMFNRSTLNYVQSKYGSTYLD